jgi:hypothetical protein
VNEDKLKGLVHQAAGTTLPIRTEALVAPGGQRTTTICSPAPSGVLRSPSRGLLWWYGGWGHRGGERKNAHGGPRREVVCLARGESRRLKSAGERARARLVGQGLRATWRGTGAIAADSIK